MKSVMLEQRLLEVRERIERACDRAGRPVESVTLVAVTKTHPPEAITELLALGIRDIGENRVQELDAKVGAIGRDRARWHLIGHLQRNKVGRALELTDLLHSIDSVRLARRVSGQAQAVGRVVEALVQVNVSGEETKGGLEGPRLLEELGEICELPGLRVKGLMTMAPFTEDVGVQRRVFAAARRLSEEASAAIPAYSGQHLSMGMSGDFEAAIEEGSTLIRLGTVLLGERPV